MTSLSEQLKRLRAPQSAAFKTGVQRASLLFDRSVAAGHDTDTVFTLGKHGFNDLLQLDSDFAEFQATLFNETSKGIERSLLSKKENEKLSQAIEKFLLRLAPYLLLTAAHQTIEWLLYKFQIDRYNVDEVLKCAMPHHDSSIFVKLLQLCTTPEYEQSPWYWLLSIRKHGVPLTRQHLLNHCASNLNFLQLICEMSQRAREVLNDRGRAMQLLNSFYVSVVCGTLGACGKVTDAIVGRLMPYIGDGLKSKDSDFVICSCMIICQLATRVVLTTSAAQALLTQLLLAVSEGEASSTILPTAVVLCQTQPVGDLPARSLKKIVKRMNKANAWESLQKLDERYDLSKFIMVLFNALVDKMASDARVEGSETQSIYEKTMRKIIEIIPLPADVATTALRRIFGHCDGKGEDEEERSGLESAFDGVVVAMGERLRQIAIVNNVTPVRKETQNSNKKDVERKRKRAKMAEMPRMETEELKLEPPLELGFLEITDASLKKLSIQKQKATFQELLVSLRAPERGRAVGAKEALQRIRPPAAFFADALRSAIAPLANEPAGSPAKKRKRRMSEKELSEMEGQQSLTDDALNRITDTLETFLANTDVERAPVMVSPLFEVLKKCLAGGDETSTTYSMQLCMSALVEVFKGPQAAGVKSTDFDVDGLVQCIRSTETPRIHQHAFHLLSVAAKLFKEDLVIRLMPIFSFMGRGLLRQDDSYTFDVIHRTIENVIPPLLLASNNAIATVTNAFRDFVISVPHIPEHRRIILLKKMVKATSKCEAGQKAMEKFAGNIIDGVECCHLWIMVGLLLEYHVMHWDKSGEAEQQDQISPFVDFTLRLCSEFSAPDQLFCLSTLLRYVDQLPDETGGSARHPMSWPIIFELGAHTSKQLRHFKYQSISFAGHVLSSSGFVGKLVELADRSSIPKNVAALFELLVEVLLSNFERTPTAKTNEAENEASKRFWQLFLTKTKSCLEKINELLPAAVSLSVITGILSRKSTNMKRYALDLLNAKLLQNPTPFTKNHIDQLSSLSELLTGWLVLTPKDLEQVVLCQCALYSLKLLVRVLAPFSVDAFKTTLDRTVAIVGDWRKCNRLYLGNAALCLAELVQCMGTETIPLLPQFAKDFVDLLNDDKILIQSDFLLISILTALQKIMEKLIQFLGPYLPDILMILSKISKRGDSLSGMFKGQLQHRMLNIRKTMAATPSRVLVSAVEQVFAKLRKAPENLALVFSVLNDHIKQCSTVEVVSLLGQFTTLFLAAFDLRTVHGKDLAEEIDQIEHECIDAFTSLALKISETNFRPIIFKLTDWASRDQSQKERLITLFRLTSKLYDTFRGLFNLFAGHVIKLAAEILGIGEPRFTGAGAKEKALLLRINVLDTVRKTCQFDNHGFINRERFDLLMAPLVEQLEKCTSKTGGQLLDHLSPCIANAAVAVKDDSAWKSVNYQILLKTRHSDANVRLAALKVLEELYGQLGSEVSGLVAETVPFLAELIEDENEEVEEQCEKVIQCLESKVGSLREHF